MKRALRYPLGGSAYLKIILIGGLLLYYERFILVPGIFVMGYLIRVIRETDKGEPPEFENWFRLAILGLKGQIIWFTYVVVVPVMVTVLTAENIVEQGRALKIMTGYIFEPYTYVITIAGYLAEFAGFSDDVSSKVISLEPIIVFILMIYLFPAALRVFAKEDRFVSGFSIKKIRAIVTNREYIFSWIQFIILWIASIIAISFPFYFGTDLSKFLVSHFGVSFVKDLIGEFVVIFVVTLGFYLLVAAYYVLGTTETVDIQSYLTSLLPTATLQSIRRKLSSHSIQVIILGGLLLSTQLLPIVALVSGYLVRVIRSEESGRFPDFDRWVQLTWDGIQMIVVWFGYIAGPILVLLAGQPVLLPQGISVVSLAQANVIVGALGVLIGPPVAYDVDRVIRDALVGLNLASLSNNPYLVRDVTAVSLSTWILFIITTLLALYLFPAAIYRVATAEPDRNSLLAGFNIRPILLLALNIRYAAKWIQSIVIWSVGSGTVIAWHVWRRYRLYIGGPSDTSITPIDLLNSALPKWVALELSIPVPTLDGIISTTFLLLTSMFCFYCLVWGYVIVATGCEP